MIKLTLLSVLLVVATLREMESDQVVFATAAPRIPLRNGVCVVYLWHKFFL